MLMELTETKKGNLAETSRTLFGISTGTGLMGFILVFLIVPPIVVSIFLPKLRRWFWTASFLFVVFGVLLVIFSLVWLLVRQETVSVAATRCVMARASGPGLCCWPHCLSSLEEFWMERLDCCGFLRERRLSLLVGGYAVTNQWISRNRRISPVPLMKTTIMPHKTSGLTTIGLRWSTFGNQISATSIVFNSPFAFLRSTGCALLSSKSIPSKAHLEAVSRLDVLVVDVTSGRGQTPPKRIIESRTTGTMAIAISVVFEAAEIIRDAGHANEGREEQDRKGRQPWRLQAAAELNDGLQDRTLYEA